MSHLFSWAPALIWATFIFYLSHQSSPPGASLLPDYVGHFILYLILGTTLVRGQTKGWKQPLSLHNAVVLFGASAAYAILDEVHQSFIPERVFSIKDISVDILGAGVAIWVLYRLLNR